MQMASLLLAVPAALRGQRNRRLAALPAVVVALVIAGLPLPLPTAEALPAETLSADPRVSAVSHADITWRPAASLTVAPASAIPYTPEVVAPTAVVAPTPQPVPTSVVAPVVAISTAEGRRADICASAWAWIPPHLRAVLATDGVSFVCLGPSKDVMAWYLPGAREIRLHVRDHWAANDAYETLMHEVGHATDFALSRISPAHRGQWKKMRGIDACWLCFGTSGDDRFGPVGDFAEAFTAAYATSASPRLGAYSTLQLAWIRALA
ncbi:MAG: hypothetical protein ACI867_000625 [Glaciecola sp.]|jgi:hypothetical protein